MAEADLGGFCGGCGREVSMGRQEEVTMNKEPSPHAAATPTSGGVDGGQGGTFGAKDATFHPLRPPSARAEAPPRPFAQDPHLHSSPHSLLPSNLRNKQPNQRCSAEAVTGPCMSVAGVGVSVLRPTRDGTDLSVSRAGLLSSSCSRPK